MESSQTSSRRASLITFVKKWFSYLLLNYELITCTIILEPWEKVFINSLVFIIFGLVAYSSWVYLPQYLVSLFAYLGRLTGLTGVATYNTGITTEL